MVIWFIGISDSGKSTLGNMLKEYMVTKKLNPFLIDGDDVRTFFKNDLGYSKEDRIANIKRIIYAVHVLEQNQIPIIVCNIAPFEDLRLFTRARVKDYNEIYLKKSIEKSVENDVKGIYEKHQGKTSLVGIDMNFDTPSKSDLTIDTGQTSVTDTFQQIINYLNTKYPSVFNEKS